MSRFSSTDDPSKSTESMKRPSVSNSIEGQVENVSRKKRLVDVDPNMNHHDIKEKSQNVDHLSQIPPELQYCITQYLNAEEVRACRLVSSDWKKMMDNLYTHDVVLDHRNGFRGDLDISMKSCKIMALGKMNCRPLFVKYASVMPTKVIIYREVNKWNLYELNYNWNNVTVLDLGWRAMASNSMFTMVKSSRSSKQFLPQLSSLKIGIPNFNTKTSSTTPSIKLNGDFIFTQSFPHLRDLSIDFVFNSSITDLFPVILTFIRAHSESIISLDIRMLALSYYSPTRHPAILFSEPQIPISDFDDVVETLINSVQYKFTPAVDSHNQDVEEWMNFLSDESPTGTIKLSRIITEKIINYPIQIIDFYKGMITETFHFITVLQLSGLSLYKRPVSSPINCEIFEQLTNLEKLILKRNPVLFETPNNHPAMQNPIEITHLSALPSSLKHLAIQGFAGGCEDLKNMMNTLGNLQRLDFTQDAVFITTNFVTGFDLPGLEKVIRHPQLKKVTISLANHVRPSFCAQFYKQLISASNWTSVFYSAGIVSLIFARSKLYLSKD